MKGVANCEALGLVGAVRLGRAIGRLRGREKVSCDTPHLLETACYCSAMLKRATVAIADIYVPVKRRATIDQKHVDGLAASILDKGLRRRSSCGRTERVSCSLRAYTV